MSLLSEFLHPERGYDEASDIISQGKDRAQGYQQPFYDTGRAELPRLSGAVGDMLHPKGLLNRLISGYSESPYANQLTDVATERGKQTASQMGLSGSGNALQSITQTAGDIASRDRSDYLNKLLNLYQSGVSGSAGLAGMGSSVGGQMAGREQDVSNKLAELAKGRHESQGSLGGFLTGLAGEAAGELGGFTPEGGKSSLGEQGLNSILSAIGL